MNPRKKKQETFSVEAQTINVVSLESITEDFSKIYGTEVVEDRAIPDFRDGLKPVHRAILWAMYSLGAHHKSRYKKAARIVGDVIGKYHPHGDASTYGACVTIANTLPNLVDGHGNWGDHSSNAAAMRYTECRLSQFSDLFLLDKDYLAVVPKVKNYSNDEEWPLFLPAKLPVQLLVGSPTVPAWGVSAGNPPFHLDGVLKLTILALQGKQITPKLCAKHLKLNYPYGGVCISDTKELETFYASGKGSLSFIPDIVVDEPHNTITISSCSPGFMSFNSISTKLNRIAGLDGIKLVEDESNFKSGKHGVEIIIETAKKSEAGFSDIVERIEKVLTARESYHLGYTYRKKDSTAFGRLSICEFFTFWTDYRLKLERAVLKHLIQQQKAALDRIDLMLFAVDNRKIILQSLDSKDPDAYLIKHLKKPAEFVKQLLDLQVRKLAALNKTKLLSDRKEVEAKIKALALDLKDPTNRIIEDTKEKMSKYVKNTSDNIDCIQRKG